MGGDTRSATCPFCDRLSASPWPYNLTPYLFLISLISGFAYMEWREWRNPGTLNRGAMMLIRGGSAGEGGKTRKAANPY